jgi:ribosomal protein L2
MAGKSWQEVKNTFHEALRLDSGERDKFLENCRATVTSNSVLRSSRCSIR